MNKRRRKQKKQSRRRARTAQPESTNANNDLLLAMAHHRDGNFDVAKSLYVKALEKDTRNGDAWHMLGMSFYQTGYLDEAMECLGNAESLLDSSASLYSNFGIVLMAAKRFDDARASLERAKELSPGQASIHSNLGVVYLELHELQMAEDEFRLGLQIEPENDQLLSNLGNALQKQRRFRDAEVLYRKVLERNPNSEIWNNLGTILKNTGKTDLAIDAFRKSISLATSPSENAYVNLGRALMQAGRLNEARQQLLLVTEQWPNSAIGYHFLGKVYASGGRHDAALEQFGRAVELDSDYAQAYGSQGLSEGMLGNTAQAIKSLKKAIELRPEFTNFHADLLYTMSISGDYSQQELLDEHLKWGDIVSRSITPYREFSNALESERKLRIGYVSGDFREHAVMKFFEPVIRCHDRSRFEIYCYSDVEIEDEVTHRIKEQTDTWKSTRCLSNQQVAELIHADAIDILVDLAGHTRDNRLIAMAHKPAPIQATWLGYPNTTGLRQIDYRITNTIQDPIDKRNYHVEEPVRLQYGSDCFGLPPDAPDVGACPALANGYVTFGSLHRPRKISPAVLQLWARVLLQVPNSRLLLFHTHYLNSSQLTDFSDQLVSHGVEKGRIEIQHEMGEASYLKMYHSIDIALDVFPWNGGTTSREALWMGVPTVGMLGDSRSSRATAAVLHLALLDDLIAKTQDQYVSIAAGLAGNLKRLSSLRNTMRERLRTTVGNAERLTSELEKAYRTMWLRYCDKRRGSVSETRHLHSNPHLSLRNQSYQSETL